MESVPHITPDSGGFLFKVTSDFGVELGNLVVSDPSEALAVRSLIARIKENPYDPSLVRDRLSVSADNLFFKHLATKSVVVVWRVAHENSSRGDQWSVIFERIEGSG